MSETAALGNLLQVQTIGFGSEIFDIVGQRSRRTPVSNMGVARSREPGEHSANKHTLPVGRRTGVRSRCEKDSAHSREHSIHHTWFFDQQARCILAQIRFSVRPELAPAGAQQHYIFYIWDSEDEFRIGNSVCLRKSQDSGEQLNENFKGILFGHQ